MRSKQFLKTFHMENKHHLNKREMCGLHGTVRRTLFCSRVMGLLPLTGLTSPASYKLRFTLRSPYMIFYAISLLGQVLMFIMTLCWLIMNGISLANITNSIFYTSSLISFLILMYIGRSWPTLIAKVEAIERKLPPFTRNVGAMSNVTTIFILTAAIVEHLLSIFYGLKVACACDINNVAENYFHFNMPWIFDNTPYTLWKAVLSELFNIQSTFIWSLNDLLIMVISIYLTEHFLIHNELLKKAAEQTYTNSHFPPMGVTKKLQSATCYGSHILSLSYPSGLYFWSYTHAAFIFLLLYNKEYVLFYLSIEHFSCHEFRTQYLKIVRLVKLINGQFGIYILTSFGSNLYWICTQLFYSLSRTQTGHFITCTFMDPEVVNAALNKEYLTHPLCMWMLSEKRALNGVEHSIYFTYSFSFLLLRTLLVLLLAARIHSNSIAPLYILYGIPSTRFHVEVERFIAQINNLKVAMSGLDFFYVTRTMILTLLGTIVTYELVLLQFNR